MQDQDKRALLDELLELTAPPMWQPGDVMLQEYADKLGITRPAAKERLQPLVDQGKLETLVVLCEDGKRRRVYRRPDDS